MKKFFITLLICAIATLYGNIIYASNTNGSDFVESSIDCPTDVESKVFICDPTYRPEPMSTDDFDVEGNFNISETIEEKADYIHTAYSYEVADDAGNVTVICHQDYYVAKEAMLKTEIESEINICQNELWSGISIPRDNTYIFYTDRDGAMGDEISFCGNSGSICPTDLFGMNMRSAGSHNFWAKRVIHDAEVGTICEAEPTQFKIIVRPTPTAQLKETHTAMSTGQLMMLMDMVSDNKNGVWKGNGVATVKSHSGENIYYYLPAKAGISKLYYTVGNNHCETSYPIVVDVQSGKKRPRLDQVNFADDVDVYPNPSSGNAFIELPYGLEQLEQLITVYDIYGHKVYESQPVYEHPISLNLTTLSKGIYVVEIVNQLSRQTKKLILE